MAAFYEQGKYKVEIVGQALTENARGNAEFQLQLKPLAYIDPKAGETELGFDYTRTQYMSLTPATVGTPEKPGWVIETLASLGFNGTSFGQLDAEHKDHISFVGMTLEAICAHEEYQGKTKEKWNILRPGGNTRDVKPIEKKNMRTLDNKFGKVLKAFAGTTPPRPKKEVEPPVPDDQVLVVAEQGEDIPF